MGRSVLSVPRLRGSSRCRRRHYVFAGQSITDRRLHGPLYTWRHMLRDVHAALVGAGFGPLDQLGRTDAKPFGQADDVVPARIPGAALYVADPALHEAGGLGKLYLADAVLVADQAHRSPEGGGIRRRGHGRLVGLARA